MTNVEQRYLKKIWTHGRMKFKEAVAEKGSEDDDECIR